MSDALSDAFLSPDDEVVATLVADALVDAAITLLDLERTVEAAGKSEVACHLLALGYAMPWPVERVFIYWGATTMNCVGCGEYREISRVHLRNEHVPKMADHDPHAYASAALCRGCIQELIDLTGLVWC